MAYQYSGVDSLLQCVPKDYLLDIYPSLSNLVNSPTLFVWGHNAYGQLGVNNTSNYGTASQTITGGTNWTQVACGYCTAAIKSDGTLWMWGKNDAGQLGINNTTNTSSPIQTIVGGNNWIRVATSGLHTAAIKSDGTLWMWGKNDAGNLGDNTITHKSSPVQTVAGGTNWRSIACGTNHTVAIKTDGTLWCWGYNQNGQLGDNSTTRRSSPIQTIAGGTNWYSASAGGQASAAIKTDGTLWCWGINNYGTLGNNSIISSGSPVQTIAGGTTW